MLISFGKMFWVVLLLLWLGFRLSAYRHRKNRNSVPTLGQEAVLLLLFIYAVQLVALTLFPIGLGLPDQPHPSANHNLTPLRTIRDFLKYDGLGRLSVINIGGNILAFMPLGVLLPLYSRRMGGFVKVVAIGLFVSCAIELLQWTGVSYMRLLDVDDVILNVLGTALGYSVGRVFQAALGSRITWLRAGASHR